MKIHLNILLFNLIIFLYLGVVIQPCRGAEDKEAVGHHVTMIMEDIRKGGFRNLEEVYSPTTIEKAFPYVVMYLNDPSMRVRGEIVGYANHLIKINPAEGISLLIVLINNSDTDDGALRSLDELPRKQLHDIGGLRLSQALMFNLSNNTAPDAASSRAIIMLSCSPQPNEEVANFLRDICKNHQNAKVSYGNCSPRVDVPFIATVCLADRGDREAKKNLSQLLLHATAAERLFFANSMKYRTDYSMVLPFLIALHDERPATIIADGREHVVNRVCDIALWYLAQDSHLNLGFPISQYPESSGMFSDKQLNIAHDKFLAFYSK